MTIPVKGTKLEALLSKDTLSMYDCGQLFSSIAELFKDFKDSVVRDSCVTIEDAEGMLHQAKELASTLKLWYDRYDQISLDLYDHAEKTYRKAIDAHEKLTKRLEKLPDIKSAYINSHAVNELVQIAERLSGISDETFNRVVELAKALSK